jgi:type I restriction enzyme S subunit
MTWGVFDEEENKALPSETVFDPRNEIRSGDLLFSRSNTSELAGATVTVGKVRSRLLLSDKSLRLLVKQGISSEWLCRTLQSPFCREQMSEMASGTSNSMRNISQEKLSSVQISVPPLAEQQEIVRRVGKLFALADVIEARLADARRMADRLAQAVLAKAFRGELVPTEAELARRDGRTYEPAADLLARVRAERPQAATKPARARRSKADPA